MIKNITDGLPYLLRTRDRWYFRRRGYDIVRLPDPSDPTFLEAYSRAVKGRPAPSGKTTVATLIESYMRSPRFTRKAQRTRKDYLAALEYLRERNGQRDVSALNNRPAIIASMEANAHRVRFANMVASVASVLLEHAKDLGWVRTNEIRGMLKMDVPKERLAPHVPWTEEAVAKFRAEATPLCRLIFELGAGSVQRPADWTRFKWSDYSDGELRLVQQKTGIELQIPLADEAKAALAAAPRLGIYILTDTRGQPLSYNQMAKRMERERKRLGLMAYDLHALRYWGIMELAWAGCTDDELASLSGHTSPAMIRKYAGRARQIMRARQARARGK